MTSSLAPILLVLLSGALLSIQSPINATLARAMGSSVNGALVSFLVGTVALVLAAAALRAPMDGPAVRALPWWAWIGGLCGAAFVTIAAYAAPRIGVATLLTLGVASQLAMALALDHVGAFGMVRQAASPLRLLGVALVVAGAVLVRRG
ncbi:MAG: DMT family transporter [Gemmatimonadaceae bacterium]|nr:DMT family transporter [Gemmatimonadaceae bacterium]